MSIPYWEDQPEIYDRLIVGDFVFDPTAVTISGDGLSNKIDIKPAPGTDGATETYQGYEPGKIEVEWLIYDQASWDLYQAMIDVIKPRVGKTAPQPVDISHPLLEVQDLRKFSVLKIPPLHRDKPGIYKAKLSVVEWFDKAVASGTGVPPKPKNGTPSIFDPAKGPGVVHGGYPMPSKGGGAKP